MAKPREFAHLIKNKFGSADNITILSSKLKNHRLDDFFLRPVYFIFNYSKILYHTLDSRNLCASVMSIIKCRVF